MNLSPFAPFSCPFFCNVNHGKIKHFEKAVIRRENTFVFVNFLSWRLKPSMLFVVYVSVLTSCGYLKYVNKLAQLLRHEMAILEYLPLHFSSKLSSSVSAVCSSTAAYTFFKSAISKYLHQHDDWFSCHFYNIHISVILPYPS